MKQNKWYKAIAIALVMCLVIALIPDIGYATDTANDSEQAAVTESAELLEPEGQDEPDVVETADEQEDFDEELLEAVADPAMEGLSEDDVVDKTETTTTFDAGNGLTTKVIHGGEVRYENEEGELVDYDPSLVEISAGEKTEHKDSLEGYEYKNKDGDKKQYLPEKLDESTPIIMEYGDNRITITPTDDTVRSLGLDSESAVLAEDIVPSIYDGEGQIMPVNAVYGSENDTAIYTYTSGDTGIKETLTLNEKPESNILTYEINVGELSIKENVLDEGITIIDPETDEIIAGIEAPWMNDATGEAYSTDITYTLEKVAFEEGVYILTMEIDEGYLLDEDIVYPVTVDPTVTWRGNDMIRDTYVIYGSGYAGTNFYETSNTKMPVGTNSTGRHRSLFKILNLKAEIEGMSVASAVLTLYESGTGTGSQTVRANRLTEDWTVSTVTWNNQPAWNTAAYTAQGVTTGTKNAAFTLDCTAFAKNVSNGTSNYGLILRNMNDDPDYACFWGSRYATTAYKPKLVVSYYSVPTTATSAYMEIKSGASGSKNGKHVHVQNSTDTTINYEGITSTGLKRVEHRIWTYIHSTDNIGEIVVDYGESSAIESGGTTPSLSEGCYRVNIRGVNEADVAGEYASAGTIHVDKTAPAFSSASISPAAASASAYTTNDTPTLSWNVSDTHFSKLTITIDGGTEAKLTTAAGEGSYKISAGKLQGDGKHTIKLTAYDKAGNTTVKSFDYYLDKNAPKIVSFGTDPETSASSHTNKLTPSVSWEVEDDNLQKIQILSGDTVLHEATSLSGTYQLANTVITASGAHELTLKVLDKAGNETEKTLTYYVDILSASIDSFEIEPSTTALTKSANKSPIISWEVTEYGIDGLQTECTVYYSIDNSTWHEIGADEIGHFALPSSLWSADEGTYTVYLKAVDAAGNTSPVLSKTYHLKAGTDYTVTDLTATEYYGKRIITWDFEAFDEDTYQYDIHRSTASDFTPSTSTLVEADIDAKYKLYMDNEVLTDGTYYYKVVTKHKTAGTQTVSDAASVTNKFSTDDLKNTLGMKEYLSYTTVEFPMSTAYIEESSGNLVYVQDDFTISNTQLDYGMSRTYNSQSDMYSMTGRKWTDSYHKEIYTAGDNIYFRDSDGSSYLFTKSGNAYACAETTEYTLAAVGDGYTVTTKDDIVYTFNGFGQLIKTSEPNGCTVVNIYDELGRLAEVKSVTANSAVVILTFVYSDDSYFLNYVDDPEGTKYTYSPDMDCLDGMTAKSKDLNVTSGNYDTVAYGYLYTSQGLYWIYDGERNLYTVNYSGEKVSKITYPDGEYLQWTYGDGVTTITRVSSGGDTIFSESTEFDTATGKVIKHTDPKGVATTYEYEGSCPYYVTKESKAQEHQTLSSDGVIDLDAAHTSTVTYGYTDDASLNLKTVTESDGTVTNYTYNSDDQITSEIVKEDGETISSEKYQYDSSGNLESTYDAIEKTQSISLYDEDGNEEASFEFEEVGNEITVSDNATVGTIDAITAGNEVSKTEMEFDEFGNADLIETETPVTKETSVKRYDRMGREIYSKEAGVVTETAYDYLGRAVTVTVTEDGLDPVITTYSYNKNGSMTGEYVTDGLSKAYEFDSRNRVTTETTTGSDIATRIKTTEYGCSVDIPIKGPDGSETEMVCYTEKTYDTYENMTCVKYIDNTGNTVKELVGNCYTDYTYDKSGNCISTVKGEYGSSIYHSFLSLYDIDGNNIANIDYPKLSGSDLVVASYTRVNEMTYDGNGNMLTSTDGEGAVTEFTYDDRDRILTCDVDSENDSTVDLTVNYTDNDDGSVLSTVTDAAGHINTETVDAAGNVIKTIDNNSASQTDILLEYSYDELGRKLYDDYSDWSYIEYTYVGDTGRISRARAVNSEAQTEAVIDYEYNGKGQVTSITRKDDESSSEYFKIQYTYDCEGKVLTETTYNGGKENVITYTYDNEGRVASKTYSSDTGLGTLNFEYDSLGRCSSIKQGTKVIRDYYYNWFGGVGEIKDYDKPGSSSYTRTCYGYDSLFRVTEMITYDGSTSTVLESHTYEYDRNDQITKYTHKNNLTSDAINETRVYTYDNHGNLTKSIKTDNADSSSVTTTYGYDSVGNRISMTEGGVTTAYTYSAADQLLTQTSGGVTVNYDYDHRGNCIQESSSSKTIDMEYSVMGEMTEWTDGTLTQTNLYDHNGQRIQSAENAVTDYYFYENGVVSVIEDSSSVTTANVLTNEGGIVGSFRGSTYYNYLVDMQGSTTNIVKEDGTLSAAYDYTDFGETTELTGNGFDNQVCYTGAIYDEETGLYYMNARYYDPEIGRFISQDSYRGELNDANQWHLYVYCANNPINYTDPSGHIGEQVLVMTGGRFATNVAVRVGYILISSLGTSMIVGVVLGGMIIAGLLLLVVKKSNLVYSKGGKQRIKDSGLSGYSDSEVSRLAKDNSLSPAQRKKFITEDKARKNRNKQKRKNNNKNNKK